MKRYEFRWEDKREVSIEIEADSVDRAEKLFLEGNYDDQLIEVRDQDVISNDFDKWYEIEEIESE